MFHIYHSNRMELLVDRLIHILSPPLTGALAPEIIVVQNPGMKRWLSQQIALESGVAANIEYPLPASFVWQIHGFWLGDLPEQKEFDRESLRWRILSLLPELPRGKEFAHLNRYLEEDPEGFRAYQLSGRIADLFDQYLVYRPDMLLNWQMGSDNKTGDAAWQEEIWRMVVSRSQGEHRIEMFSRFRELSREDAPAKGELPERVCIFGLSSLAPVHLHAFETLARHTAVHLSC
jgi:exodeoxyribonuclease V gamma subunit